MTPLFAFGLGILVVWLLVETYIQIQFLKLLHECLQELKELED